MSESRLGKVVSAARRLAPAAMYMTATVLARAGALLLVPLYTRRLSEAEYGDLAIAQTLLSLLPPIVTGGLVTAIPRFFFAKSDEAIALRTVGSIAAWNAVLAFAGGLVLEGVVLALSPYRWGHLGFEEFSLVVVAMIGSCLSSVPDAVLRTRQRARAAALYQLCVFFLTIVPSLYFVVWLEQGFIGAMRGLALGQALAGVVGAALGLAQARGPLDRAVLRDALRFTLPFVPHLTANWLFTAGDRLVLKAYGLENALGPYALAGQVVQPALYGIGAWNDAESPKLGEQQRREGASGVQNMLTPMRRSYLLVWLAAAVATLIGLPLLPWLTGARFADAVPYVPVFVALAVSDAVYIPNANILYYLGRTRWIPWITVASGVSGLVVAVVAVRFLGPAGALVARLASGTLRGVLVYVLSGRALRADLETQRLAAAS